MPNDLFPVEFKEDFINSQENAVSGGQVLRF